jgi:hypothetical protein
MRRSKSAPAGLPDACTLYLSLLSERVCVTKRASFGFHLPYGMSDRQNAVAARYMMRKYPSWVSAWIADHGGLTDELKIMPASYAARHIGYCG